MPEETGKQPQQEFDTEMPPPEVTREQEESELVERPPVGGEVEISQNVKIWSILVHASIFVLPVFGPLIVLALQESILGDRSDFLTHHAKQAAVWQFAAVIVGLFTFGLGGLIMAIWGVLAAFGATRGERYMYPLIGQKASEML